MTPATPPPLGTCRFCGRPSWKADEKGPVHPCCVFAAAEGKRCVGCSVAFSTAPTKRRGKR